MWEYEHTKSKNLNEIFKKKKKNLPQHRRLNKEQDILFSLQP